jgi:cytoskeletal protein RodZ
MNGKRPSRRGRRRGSVLVYSTVLLVVFLGLVSLGMDYAH